MDLSLIFTFILLIICFLGLSWFAGSDAPYVATKISKIPDVLKKAGVKKNTVFYELGSGDGRVVFEAAKLGSVAHGIEQSLIRVLLSKYRAKRLNLKNAFFHHGNVFNFTYKDADVVYIYLLTEGVAKLERKLKKELTKGKTVITQTYHFKNQKPKQTIDNFNIYQT